MQQRCYAQEPDVSQDGTFCAHHSLGWAGALTTCVRLTEIKYLFTTGGSRSMISIRINSSVLSMNCHGLLRHLLRILYHAFVEGQVFIRKNVVWKSSKLVVTVLCNVCTWKAVTLDKALLSLFVSTRQK